MVSLRFPFLFSQPTSNFHPNPPTNATTRHFSVAVALSAAAAAGVAAYQNQQHPFVQNALNFLFSSHSSSHLWGSLSLADNSSATVVDSKSGFSFPSVIRDSRKLLGIGLRKKSVLGLKNIDVYAFGVYADHGDVKKLLSEKYGNLPLSELKENKKFIEDLMEADICMTVRLQIIYGRLSIRSVRSAFEESVGSRLQKFCPADNKELLQRFTSLFKDEYQIPKGSLIDLSKEHGYVLQTTSKVSVNFIIELIAKLTEQITKLTDCLFSVILHGLFISSLLLFVLCFLLSAIWFLYKAKRCGQKPWIWTLCTRYKFRLTKTVLVISFGFKKPCEHKYSGSD